MLSDAMTLLGLYDAVTFDNEALMTKETRSPNDEELRSGWTFGFRVSFIIRASSLVI